MRFTTAIFDMDGVVTDSEKLFERADGEFFARYGYPYNRQEMALLLAGMDLKKATILLKKTFGFKGEVEDLYRERKSLLKKHYKSSLTFIQGFPEFLTYVGNLGIKSCIATASDDELVVAVDDKLQISDLFANNIFKLSQVDNKSKPDPAIFLYAAAQMDALPGECFVIEDSPKGIEAAKNAGMYCIGITTTFPKEKLSEAESIVDSFEEIKRKGLLNT